MGKRNNEDFAEYELDWDDPYTEGLVKYVSMAIVKLYHGFKKNMSPSLAFNEFVNAWEYFYFMPENTQAKSRKFMDACSQMWADVSKTKADEFCQHCTMVVQKDANQDTTLCEMCSDMIEAIFALDGRLPEATHIFDAAYEAIKHGETISDACIAYLYVLCARIWYKCLGYPSTEEELMLSEGIKHHLKAKAQGVELKTDLYSLHMATAIYDASYVRLREGTKLEEISNLVHEAYTLLSNIDSPAALMEKKDFYQLTGIPYPGLEKEGQPWMVQLYNNMNDCLPN
ncbi:MAG: hypothetical protein J6W82_09625 [Bacteroidales bacterium]|nr:hypothetical protein [Bacteroidales bacterium]